MALSLKIKPSPSTSTGAALRQMKKVLLGGPGHETFSGTHLIICHGILFSFRARRYFRRRVFPFEVFPPNVSGPKLASYDNTIANIDVALPGLSGRVKTALAAENV